jgi:uncharacterized membrane protein
MYKIIGADQREYGPVTAEQVREWIAEGRANGATKIQAEGNSEWLPLSAFPEFADALAAKAPPPAPELPPPPTDPAALAQFIRTRDYTIDLGACVSRSWALLTNHFALMVGAAVLLLILVIGCNQLLSLLTGPAMRSLMTGDIQPGSVMIVLLANIPEMAFSWILTGGYYILLLKLVRGQEAGIADLFAGFGAPALPLALAGIVIQILTVLGILACIIPGVYLSVAWILTGLLIVDRHLGFWTAMELSRKVVTRHWFPMFCLLAVMALISLAGFIACCVGFFVAMPIGLGALVYAYEDIFHGPATTVT